jgi:hypothetical protein
LRRVLDQWCPLAAVVFRACLSPCLEPRHDFRSVVIIGVLGESLGLAGTLTRRIAGRSPAKITTDTARHACPGQTPYRLVAEFIEVFEDHLALAGIGRIEHGGQNH